MSLVWASSEGLYQHEVVDILLYSVKFMPNFTDHRFAEFWRTAQGTIHTVVMVARLLRTLAFARVARQHVCIRS